MPGTIRRVAAATLLATLSPVSVDGQSEPAQPQATFRSGVDIVRLDVSVLDKNRRPIRDLTAADFTVLEEGEARPIVAFSAVDVPGAPEHSVAWMRDVGSDVATNRLDTRRIVAIVMDDCYTNVGDGKVARNLARSVVDRLGPNDLAGVVFTGTGRAQNFTPDHQQLITAIDSFVSRNSPPPHRFTAAYGSPSGGGSPLGCGLRGGLSATLKEVAVALKDTPEGRKAIVLTSPGIPFSFSLETLEAAEEGDDVLIAFEALQRANVNVYAFDPSGLTQEGINAARIGTLQVFAENTGGRAVVATNAPEQHVSQVFVENGSYYLLGIRGAAPDSRDRFRKVTVKVNRPDVEIRTRPGYYVGRSPTASAITSAPPPPRALDKAFGNALPTGDLPLSVSVAPFGVAGKRDAVLAVMIGTVRPVSDRVVTETLQLRTTAFEYGVYRDRGTSVQTLELTARPNAMGERRFEVPARLTVRPGRYEVRVGAETSDGAAGGVYVAAEAPDFAKAKLALSGLVMGLPRRASADATDEIADLIPISPTVRRKFSASEPLVAFLRIYQGGMRTPATVRVMATIVDSTNRQVFSDGINLEPERFAADRSADYELGLAKTRLAPGDYLLTIEVRAANNAARRMVRFTVT